MSAVVKGCQMPATQHRAHRTAAVQGQASDKPQGRKPREQDAVTSRSTVLWGFEFGVVVLTHVNVCTLAMRPATTYARHPLSGHFRTSIIGIGPSEWCRCETRHNGIGTGDQPAIDGFACQGVRTLMGHGGAPPRCAVAQGA